MALMRRNLKLLVFLYLVFCMVPVAFAVTKPSYLSAAGDAESKADNLIKSIIDWVAILSIGMGAIGVLVGGIMLVPVLGQAQRAKYFFLGGFAACAFGAAGLSLVGWVFDKLA